MKDYDKTRESLYLKYWDISDLCGWSMLQKLPINRFGWTEDASQFNEDFIKNYIEESDENFFIKVSVQYAEKLHELHNDLPFLSERIKIENVEKLVNNLHNKSFT